MHCHVEVTRGRAAKSSLALTGQPNALPVFDPRRNPNVDGAGAHGLSGALALGTRVLDDRATAAAIGARFGESERSLIAVDHARAVARAAHRGAGAWTRAATVAVRARRRARDPQRHLHTLGGLEEVEFRL